MKRVLPNNYAFETNSGNVVSVIEVNRHLEIVVFDEFGESQDSEWFFDVEEMVKRFSALVSEYTLEGVYEL